MTIDGMRLELKALDAKRTSLPHGEERTALWRQCRKLKKAIERAEEEERRIGRETTRAKNQPALEAFLADLEAVYLKHGMAPGGYDDPCVSFCDERSIREEIAYLKELGIPWERDG